MAPLQQRYVPLSIVHRILFTPTGFFPSRNVAFCTQLRKLSPYAQSAVWTADMGVGFQLHSIGCWLIVRQNSILCCSVVCCDFPHFWHYHHLDWISDVGCHSHSSDVARAGCKWYSHWDPPARLASHVVLEYKPTRCLPVVPASLVVLGHRTAHLSPVVQDHRTSITYGHYPLSCLICVICDCRILSVALAAVWDFG